MTNKVMWVMYEHLEADFLDIAIRSLQMTFANLPECVENAHLIIKSDDTKKTYDLSEIEINENGNTTTIVLKKLI